MNTRIVYMYRDGSNYKYYVSVIVGGKVSCSDLLPFLSEKLWFAPHDVDLPHPGKEAEGWPNDDDHCWCELRADDFEPVDLASTHEEGSILIERFRQAHEKSWPTQNEGLISI